MAKFYTFKNLQDEVLRYMDEDTNTSSTTLTLVKNAINRAHFQRLTSYDWYFMLWPKALTFDTVLNQQQYSLHSEFYKPLYFFNQTVKAYMIQENGRMLGPSGVRWNTDTGNATRFSLWGQSALQNQLLTPSQVVVFSSNAGDTGITVKVVGQDTTTLSLTHDTLTLSGTTHVVSTKTFADPILHVTISAPLTGVFTMKDVTETRTLLTLDVGQFGVATGELGKTFPQIYILSIPNVVNTIEYRFYRQPFFLVDDDDIPDIPPPFTQILVWDTLLDVATYDASSDPDDVATWRMNSQKLEESMLLWNDEMASLESEPRYIRYLGEEPDAPRIYTT